MAAAIWEHHHMYGCNMQNTMVWIPSLLSGRETALGVDRVVTIFIPQYETKELIQEGL